MEVKLIFIFWSIDLPTKQAITTTHTTHVLSAAIFYLDKQKAVLKMTYLWIVTKFVEVLTQTSDLTQLHSQSVRLGVQFLQLLRQLDFGFGIICFDQENFIDITIRRPAITPSSLPSPYNPAGRYRRPAGVDRHGTD